MANLLDPRSSGGAETLSLSQVSFLHQMAMGWILLNFMLTIDDKMNPHYKIENDKDCLDDYALRLISHILPAEVEDNNVEIVCTSVNTFG